LEEILYNSEGRRVDQEARRLKLEPERFEFKLERAAASESNEQRRMSVFESHNARAAKERDKNMKFQAQQQRDKMAI
jgi:hypothetical protein